MPTHEQLRMSFPTAHHLRLQESLIRYGLSRRHGIEGASAGCVPNLDFLRLRRALQECGEVCSLFGLYLSTRIDLLALDNCIELSRIPDSAQPSPFADVQEFVERELGFEVDQVFLAIEPMPYETSLLGDFYIAMLKTGENISLHVLRREFRSFPQEQVAALQKLEDCVLFGDWKENVLSDCIVDFARELGHQLDQLEVMSVFDALNINAQATDCMWVPKPLRSYCRRGILGLEPFSTAKASFRAAAREGVRSNFEGPVGLSAHKAAQTVCLSWLHQVFHGHLFPVQFTLNDISLSSDGQVAFLGRVFSSPFPDSNEKLWTYLLAAAADDPDACCTHLLALLIKTRHSEPEEELRASFRQAVTCFLSEPNKPDFCSGLSARILRQLNLVIQAGYRPNQALITFYRGLFSVLMAVHSLQSRGDPLLEALEGLRMKQVFDSMSRMMRMDALGDMGSKYLTGMMELPARIDALLSAAHSQKKDFAEDERVSGSGSYVIAVILLVTALLLLTRSGPIHFAPEWNDRITFVICLLIGFCVLRLAERP